MLVLAIAALSLNALPELVPVPKGVSVDEATLAEHTWDEGRFLQGKTEKRVRGRTWLTWCRFDDGQSHPAKETWAAWKPLLEGKGWKIAGTTASGDAQGTWSLTRKEGAAEAWLSVGLGDYDAPRVVLVQAGGTPMKLTAKAPDAPAASVKEADDWPFVPKLPNAKLTGTSQRELAFIMRAGEDQTFIADSYLAKEYAAVRSLSRLEFVTAFGDAMKAAGWAVPVVDAESGVFWAHFVKNGRDVWLCGTNADDGTDQSIGFSVVDTANDFAKALASPDCRIALRGVTFDFNRATLKSESEPTLLAVVDALKGRSTLKLEIAGHTDNVGDDAYNQKLSEQRATAVKTWLAAHGVAADRLTAKGYGKTAPVTSNESEEGRAKNRRVELVCAK